MIELRELTKTYGDSLAVDHLTACATSGRVTGFLGPNGAGKSTTMRMMLGLDRPTSGEALIGGVAYRDLRHPLRRVGALLDASWVEPKRTARSHLAWLAASHAIPRTQVEGVLDRVGLTEVASTLVGTFSFGMRQRLGIAAALLGDPEVIVLDEPANGLDPEGISWLRGLLQALAAEGRTVFLSSHLLSEMAETAHDLIVIGRGRLIDHGPVEQVIGRAGPTATYVECENPAALEAALVRAGATVQEHQDGMLIGGLATADVGRCARDAQMAVFELRPVQRSLEEVFLQLTDGAQRHRGRPSGGPLLDPGRVA